MDSELHISIRASDDYPGYVNVGVGADRYYGADFRSMFAEDDEAGISKFIADTVPQAVKLAMVKARAEAEQEARELAEATEDAS